MRLKTKETLLTMPLVCRKSKTLHILSYKTKATFFL